MATPIKDRNLFTATPDPLFSSYMNPVTQQEIDAALGINTPPPQFPVISEVENIDVGPLTYEPSELDLTVDPDKYGSLSFSKFKGSLEGMTEPQLRNLKGELGSEVDIPPTFVQAIDDVLEKRMTPFERDVGRNIPGASTILHRASDAVGPAIRNVGQLPYDLGVLGSTYFFGEGAEQDDEIQAKLDEMRDRHSFKEAQEKMQLEADALLARGEEVPEDFVGPQQTGIPPTRAQNRRTYLKEKIFKPAIKKWTDWLGTSPNHPDYDEAVAEGMAGGDTPLLNPETGEPVYPNLSGKPLDPDEDFLAPAPIIDTDETVEIDENGKVQASIEERDVTGVVTDDRTKTIPLKGPGIYESLFEREYGFLRPRPLDRAYRMNILFQKIGEQMAATGSVAEGFSKGSAAANQEIREREMEDVEIRNKAAERARDTYEALLAAQAAGGTGLELIDATRLKTLQDNYNEGVETATSAQNALELLNAAEAIIKGDPLSHTGIQGAMRLLVERGRKAIGGKGGEVSDTALILEVLGNLKIQELLNETGKTISDRDRIIVQEIIGNPSIMKRLITSESEMFNKFSVARSQYEERRKTGLRSVKFTEQLVRQNPSWGAYLELDPLIGKGDVLLDENGEIIAIRRGPLG
jgi:hypothetical protein